MGGVGVVGVALHDKRLFHVIICKRSTVFLFLVFIKRKEIWDIVIQRENTSNPILIVKNTEHFEQSYPKMDMSLFLECFRFLSKSSLPVPEINSRYV